MRYREAAAVEVAGSGNGLNIDHGTEYTAALETTGGSSLRRAGDMKHAKEGLK